MDDLLAARSQTGLGWLFILSLPQSAWHVAFDDCYRAAMDSNQRRSPPNVGRKGRMRSLSGGSRQEMLVKLYALTWVLEILTALLFYVSGNLTPIISVVLGILAVGTVFMGLIAVLPSSFAQKNEREITEHRRGNQDVQRPLSVSLVNFNSRPEKIFEHAHAFNQRP